MAQESFESFLGQQNLVKKRFRERFLKNPESFAKVRHILVAQARRKNIPEDPWDKIFKALLQDIPKWMLGLKSSMEE